MLVQNTGRVAEQGIGQSVRPDAAGELVRAGAHHQRNAAVALGMEVLGYDPYISIDAAWSLSRSCLLYTSRCV